MHVAVEMRRPDAGLQNPGDLGGKLVFDLPRRNLPQGDGPPQLAGSKTEFAAHIHEGCDGLRGQHGWALGQVEVHSDGQSRLLAAHIYGGAEGGSVRENSRAGYDAVGVTLYDSAVDVLGEAKIVRVYDELFQGTPRKLAQ